MTCIHSKAFKIAKFIRILIANYKHFNALRIKTMPMIRICLTYFCRIGGVCEVGPFKYG